MRCKELVIRITLSILKNSDLAMQDVQEGVIKTESLSMHTVHNRVYFEYMCLIFHAFSSKFSHNY
jgi:hypothetical protein